MKHIRRLVLGWFSVALIGAGLVAFPAMAAAGYGGDNLSSGNCSGATDWQLKLSPEDGRIKVEGEIESEINGQHWNVKLKRNGNVVWTGMRTTHGPSGSFEVSRLANDGAGTDNFVLKATNPATGEVCRGTGSI